MLRACLAGLGALSLAGCTTGEAPPTQTPDSILQGYGYTIRVPASKLHGPGSLVFRRAAPASAAARSCSATSAPRRS